MRQDVEKCNDWKHLYLSENNLINLLLDALLTFESYVFTSLKNFKMTLILANYKRKSIFIVFEPFLNFRW